MQELLVNELAARVERLERENAHLQQRLRVVTRRVGGVVVATVSLLVLGAALQRPPDVIEAQRFALVNDERQPLAALGVTKDGRPFLSLGYEKNTEAGVSIGEHTDGMPFVILRQHGKARIALRIDGKSGEAAIAVKGADGQQNAKVVCREDGKVALAFYDQKRMERAVLMLNSEGFPSLGFFSQDRKPRLGLRAREDGAVGFNLYHESGVESVGLMTVPNTPTRLTFFDGVGTLRAYMDGSPRVWLGDEDGDERLGLQLDEKGPPSLYLSEKGAKARLGMSVGADGTPIIELMDEDGKTRLGMQVDHAGKPKIDLLGQDGKPQN